LAALPLWRPDDKFYWHVGGAMSHRDPVEDSVQIRIRSNVRNAPFPLLPLLVNTGLIEAKSQDLFNLETAAVWGPLTFQAEYTANLLHDANVAATPTKPAGPPQGTLFFQGYYAEAMWLVTGESRTWNNKFFYFNRVSPLRPLRFRPGSGASGPGAWELAVRFSHLDTSNKAVRAGVINSVTLGVNWYLNTNAKIQCNYDYAQIGNKSNGGQGHVHSLGIRSAFDF
jgi:phosphate-selective porin OprO/OprP